MNTLIKYKTNLKTKSIIIHEAECVCLETMIESRVKNTLKQFLTMSFAFIYKK